MLIKYQDPYYIWIVDIYIYILSWKLIGENEKSENTYLIFSDF